MPILIFCGIPQLNEKFTEANNCSKESLKLSKNGKKTRYNVIQKLGISGLCNFWAQDKRRERVGSAA